ncbi:MAG TPA: hypothetical protein VM784_03490 [Actinomycetota bacterium]|nr:hypothetical protein [Actinomycetota bacterium]
MTVHMWWGRMTAAALLLLGAVCVIVTGIIIGRGGAVESLEAMTLLLPAFFFCLVGALIVYRRPDNRMGWIFAAIGLFSSTGSLADEYASLATEAGSTGEMPVVLASWYSEWFWIPFIFLTFCFSVLLFPSGSPPSPRWRPFIAIVGFIMLAFVVLAMLDPIVTSAQGRGVANPIGVSGLPDVDDEPFIFILGMSLLVSAVAALSSLIVRFRRSRGEEREQLKWFTYSAAVMVASFILVGLVFDALLHLRIPLLETLTMAILPIGAGIAILKYRLYDIDVIINRTLVYGMLSAVLVGAYGGGVLLFRTILDPITGDNDIAIAASTLAVAGLFGPARRRIQGFIDRRFYRSRYDARLTLELFSTRLRDEVDLDALESELLHVVADTVQPRHASVWLARETP